MAKFAAATALILGLRAFTGRLISINIAKDGTLAILSRVAGFGVAPADEGYGGVGHLD